MDNKHRFILWTVVLVAAVTLLPFLGMTDFNTKGEPREAVVAMAMLDQHNWILPASNGVDFPHHPPFFQWCIAAFSLPIGHVTVFTSRLPSALALIIMLAMGAVFYAKRKNTDLGFLSAMLTLTAFEVHRAGTNARVDMVFTMFIVCGLYAFYRWWESKMHGLPWLAILCVSGAALTKGLAGIILPLIVMFVFICLSNSLNGRKWYQAILKLLLSAVLACLLPGLWYFSVYRQMGIDILYPDVVTTDDIRPYNVLLLLSGWLPWSVPLLLTLFVLPWKKWLSRLKGRNFKEKLCKAFSLSCREGRGGSSVQLFTWLSFLLIFFFYCIPESKRGANLLPCYPFMAALIVDYAVWMMKRSKFPILFYIGFLSVAGFLLTITLVLMRAGLIPDNICQGNQTYTKMMHALAYNSLAIGDIILLLLPLAAACLGLSILLHRKIGFITDRPVLASTFMTLLFFMSFDGYYRPTTLNTRSYKPLATQVLSINSIQKNQGDKAIKDATCIDIFTKKAKR